MKTTYGYEALRIPWRLALDWQWSRDERAKEVLSRMNFLEKEWEDKGRLASVYAHDGKIENNSESAAMYGGSLGYFIVMDPKKAEEIYRDKLLNLYNPDTSTWRKDAGVGYYEANMAWFGMALYRNLLLNFTTS
jgi:endoglucanase